MCAVKVASILAEVGIDSSKFTAGANNLSGATSGLVGKMGGLGKGLNEISMGLTGMNIASLAGAGGIIAVGNAVIDATKETQAYNLAMVDMARKMGTTTEEASRLVQVGDDVRLSQEQISTAMTFAIRNGVEPNIEGLAKLADEYNALSTPVEKGQLLLKNFGRSGMEMGKLMEKGGDGIREMSAAIEDNMIVTAEAAEASKKFYEAQDKLGDAWTGMKMQIGNVAIPALTRLMDIQTKYGEVMDDNTQGIAHAIPLWGVVAAVVKSFGDEADTASEYTNDVAGSLDVAGQSARNAAVDFGMTDDQLKELNETNKTMISMTERFSDMTDLTAEEHQKATRKIVLGYLEQQLAVGGLDERETEYLLSKGQEWGVYSASAVASMRSAMAEAQNLARSINNIPSSKTSNVYVNTIYSSYGSVDVKTAKNYLGGKALGGPASGRTIVGELGEEAVDLPKGSFVHNAKDTAKQQEFDYNRMARTLRDVLLQVGR